ncbi:MAG: bis-aminopropyl spermidine synthase family protein [Candidatus Helarchaeota archaeon]|nr:bis-aminopropyl spermidine synthase family protein [Candidatus Helarchaeota archaeon]
MESVKPCILCGNHVKINQNGFCEDCNTFFKKLLDDIYSTRPERKRDLDQFGLDYDSVIAQNLFLKTEYKRRSAAFLGGYDGVGLLATQFDEANVLLIDIDERVIDWWIQVGREIGFEVIGIQYDVKEPINEKISDVVNSVQIDLWRTDPPFNCPGIFSFLSRIFHLNQIQKSPIFLCIPIGTNWTQLLKHQVWSFLQKSGMKITEVSPTLYKYPDPEGPNSFALKIIVEKYLCLIKNYSIEFDINRITKKFADSPLGCGQFEICRSWRDMWKK